MDKRVIFAVAGSGKTTHIVENLSFNKKTLIVTYTTGNCENLRAKILTKFNDEWPKNVTLMSYFTFLYSFCYKPFVADKLKAKGILYDKDVINGYQSQKRKSINKDKTLFYMTAHIGGYLFSNRLAYLIQNRLIGDVKDRLVKYFDEFIVDEVQDIAGRDFNFLECLMSTDINMLFVGDFYQHTFDTSNDGNTNQGLFRCKNAYEQRFSKNGMLVDKCTLIKSWRCSINVCDYIRKYLGIEIYSNRSNDDNTKIEYITDMLQLESILSNKDVSKLHYEDGAKFRITHGNWGASKGEDHHNNVCVFLNNKTMKKQMSGTLDKLSPFTKNKLYVAITRARGDVYFANEESIKNCN